MKPTIKIFTIISICLILSPILKADYNNISLKDFANIVAAQDDINIVLDNKLDKSFTFIITRPINNYTNLDVFRQLLEQNGYELDYRKNYYIIIKRADKRVKKIAIFHTQYVNARNLVTNIRDVLQSFYAAGSKLQNRSSKKSSLTISPDKNNTKYKDFSLTAIDNNTLVLTYKDKYIKDFAQEIIANVDKRKKQITILAKIYEVDTSALVEKGINVQATGELTSRHFNTTLAFANNLPIISFSNSLQFNTFIKLLHNNKYSHLISSPKLQVLEDSKAVLKDGSTYPIISQNTTVSNSSTTTQTKKINYVDIGIIFTINFLKNVNGFNYLNVQLQKKDLLNYNPDSQDIITTNREIQTKIRIKNNSVIVIAGLGKITKSKTTFKVPLLNKIPILGNLFKYKSNTTENTTLVITLECIKTIKKSINVFKRLNNAK